ncbi:MAG: GNAT family N-acetyltransferase [Candidatus Zixiibacteriota bacterium]|nr:MAG: GNAT family N-acetyltransferase [candidate division Zixibacteria bacterium]
MIEGKKVRIRAIEKTDIDEIMKWVNDREVMDNLIMRYPVSRYQEEKWIEKALDDPNPRNKVFALETKDGVYLGGIGLHRIDWENRSAEVGIVIGNKEYWNKGYGSDSMMTLLEFAFDRMNLHRVYLKVYDFNLRGIKSYEKCGFRREGVLRHDLYVNGEYHDSIIMGILRDEFKKTPNEK